MTVKIPVNIAPQVVAAGIYGDRARITVVLVPVFNTEKEAQENPEYDVAAWPEAVEKLLRDSKGFEIIPLKHGESWRTDSIFQDETQFKKIEKEKLRRFTVPPDVEKLSEYWYNVMGEDDGFAALKSALDPRIQSALRDPLDAALRDPESKTGPLTPDIHGTWRGKSATEHSFERAAHTAASLRRDVMNTRPDAKSADALSVRVEEYIKKKLGPWPKNVPQTNAYFAAVADDIDAYGQLKTSREHADKFAAARRTYQNTKSSSDAIDALVATHDLLVTRSPLATALHFGDPSNFTDKVKRKTLTRAVLKEAAAAYRLASRTPVFNGKPIPPAEDDPPIEFARRRLFTIQSNPSLARLFGFVIDFDCARSVLENLVSDAQQYPELVLDLDPAALDKLTDGDKLPDAVSQNARFLLIRLAAPGKGSRVWSTAKLRQRKNLTNQAGHFLPCTREEIDARVKNKDSDGRELAVFGQIDGIVDLGQSYQSEQRYNIISLDPVTAIGGEDATEKRRAEDKKTLENEKRLLPVVRAQLETPKQATQRGGGLALADRWRQLHGIERFLDSGEQRNQFNPKAEPKDSNVVLDASDLTAGYKLDVGIRQHGNLKIGRNHWHTLMHRKVEYMPTHGVPAHVPPKQLDGSISKLYPDSAARRDADDAQLQAPAALRDWLGDPSGMTHTTVFMEEVIGAWRGDPLGLHCGVESHQLDSQDVRIDINYSLPSDRDLTPPPLRFGWGYHLGLRAAFAGGVSLPLNRALGHYEKSRDYTLAMPATYLKSDDTHVTPNKGTPFLRHERIETPTIAIPDWLFGELKAEATYTKVALKGRFPVPQASRMVVCTVNDETNRRIVGTPDEPEEQRRSPGIGFDRRVIVAPTVSLDFAALHDAFRGKRGDDIKTKVLMCEPRVLRDRDPNDPKDTGDDLETKPIPNEEAEVTEFTPVPEPLNRSDTREGLRQRWQKVRVAWRPFAIATRPRGGLCGIDRHAAWGGFPIYRARASAGTVEPVENALVTPAPAPTTDEGEILYRIKGKGPQIFANDSDKRRDILWSAVGVLPNSGGSIDRAGTAVFRPLPSGRKDDTERQPYYPDPAAVTLVIQVAVRGQGFEKPRRFDTQSVSLYKGTFNGSAPPDYPDAVPVVLDVLRGDGTGPLIKVTSRTDYGRIPFTPPPGKAIPAAHVTVALAPGDEARIRCWCVPTEAFLGHIWAGTRTMAAMAIVTQSGIADGGVKALDNTNADEAFRQGIKSLTTLTLDSKVAIIPESTSAFAGLPLPSPLQMLDFAKKMRERMLKEPVPEIAAITEIEAVHAVDLPLHDPKPGDGPNWQLLRADKNTIENIILSPADKCDPATQPLCASQNWTIERQQPDAVDVVIDGSLFVHGPTTGAVELRARGAAAARGRFDDVERGRSRDDRERGLWPRPDAQEPIKAHRLFGFDPAEDGSVTFEPETVTLLRIEGFAPGTGKPGGDKVRIDLHHIQRAAKAIEPKSGEDIQAHDPPLRISRPAAFPDTRARFIEIYGVALSRHATALRTRYDELPEVLTRPKTALPGASQAERKQAEGAIGQVILDKRWLPATVRPARIAHLSSIFSFAWKDNIPAPSKAASSPNGKVHSVFVSRSVQVRVRAKRPWFSSGEGERLAVVIWPPNLFGLDASRVHQDLIKPPPDDRIEINLRALREDGSAIRELQDTDLGAGGSWVTRWGADPIRAYGGVQGWLLSKDNFPGVLDDAAFSKPPHEHPKGPVLVKSVLMPVPVDADAAELRAAQPPGGFMPVSLITYAPRFDADQEMWYADIDIDPCGAVYPFVRLGLVRYQPNAAPSLQVSEPVVEWAQIMPARKLTASAKYIDTMRKQVEVTAVVEGISSGAGNNHGHPESSPAQAPRMYFSLLQRRIDRDDELLSSEIIFGKAQIPEPKCGSPCASWTAVFHMSDDEYRSWAWSVLVEEVDLLRPATYLDEPRYDTLKDGSFVNTGPRFVGRLPLDNLRIGT